MPSKSYDFSLDLSGFTGGTITLVAGDVAGNEQTQIINIFTVTCNLNGGNISGNNSNLVSQVIENQCAVRPADPQKSGYTFEGWYKQGESVPYDFTTPITEDTELVAHYTLVNAEIPTIVTDISPTEIAYTAGDTAEALTVSASVYDGGTLSYQWYSNISNSAIGGTVVGTNSAAYTPDTSETGTLYYYVVITNTIPDNDDGGNKTATATSAVARVTVNPDLTPIYAISLNTSGTYTFTAATEGYETQAAKNVIITYMGNRVTGVISLVLAGANSDDFNLSSRSIPNIATGSNTTFTVAPDIGLGAGTYTARVSVTSAVYSEIDESFDVNFTVNAFTPVKQKQTITWSQSNFTATEGDSPITLNASANSGLTVSYSSDNTAVATVSGNTLTIVGAGTVTITASQAGNASYNAAANVTRTITVNARSNNDDDDEEESSSGGSSTTPGSTTLEIGGTKNQPHPGQTPMLNTDGSQTLPKGGSITITPTTESNTGDAPIVTFNVPSGTTVGQDGSVIIPETGNVTITITTPSADPDNPGGKTIVTVTVPGGSYISGDGTITTGSGSAQLTLPDNSASISLPQGTTVTPNGIITTGSGSANLTLPGNSANISLPQGTTVTPDGTVTIPNSSGASVSLPGGCTLSAAPNSVIILDEATPLGYYVVFDNPFADVNENNWFYNNMEFVNTGGLYLGTSDTTFSPSSPMTRDMFVTVLHRLAGSPDTSGLPQNFTDVAADAYYAEAVKWAAANGITSGTAADKFSPDDSITREQAATFFYNFAKAIGAIPDKQGDSPEFADMDKVSSWALDALHYSTDAGILVGKPGNLLDPQAKASRAEVAAMFHRFVLLLAGKNP